ncbi:MAG: lipid-A-disaccharide synthase [Flavobacteriales bacterium]
MKYYLVAGEASGDLHGAHLIKALKTCDSEAEFRGWGGDLMRAAGMYLLRHYRDTAVMGFAEVLAKLPRVLQNISACKADLAAYRPDAVILIDYPGFNLRLAAYAQRIKVKTYYYISPQVWAWKANRVHAIKRTVNRLFVILPFEKAFYERYGYPVDFVGHPLLDVIENRKSVSSGAFTARNRLPDKPVIALLPGSRRQEIDSILPLLLGVVADFPDYQFVVAAAPGQQPELYKRFLRPRVAVVAGQTHDLLSVSQAALVASGTATLEAALFGVPEVVCYKTSWFSYAIGKRLVHLKHISLVNLILERAVVKELVQGELTEKNIKAQLQKILQRPERARILRTFAELKDKLGGSGASIRTARLIRADLDS